MAPQCGVRYMVCFSVWFSLVSFYVLRSNMSVAILAMTVPQNISNGMVRQFDWSDNMKGQVLAGFFYGYASTHFIGALISSRMGPRILLTVCLLGSSLATLVTPYLTHKSPYALIFARVMVGIFSGSLYPIIQEVLGVWTPQAERTVLASLTHSGNIFGIVLTYVTGSYFCGPTFGIKGWEYFFYFSGGLSSFACILWLCFGFDSPSKHPYISKKEVHYIKGVGEDADEADHGGHGAAPLPSFKSIPFKEIFTSIPVWTATAAHAGYLFIFYAMVTGQSKFLSDSFHLSIPEASLYSAIPFIANFLGQILVPPIVDYLRNRRHINITRIRRTVSAIGFIFGCTAFMCVGFFNSNQFAGVIIVMTFALGIIGLNSSGYLTASIDISPAYAGIVMGLMNTFGSIAGFLNSSLAGYMVGKYSDDKIIGWRYTFIITSIVSLFLGMLFVLFGSSEPQPWAKGKMYMPVKQTDEQTFMLSPTEQQKNAGLSPVKVSRV